MKRSAPKNLKLYPHFKLTNEKFPRLLATRKIENDKAEYFGAFLPKTGARVLLGFVNKFFKLRSCEIDIEQGLPIPCPMFYRKRCLAPCVENICDEAEYAKNVELLRFFLGNERTALKTILTKKIETFSEEFDFENAAEWRDFLLEIEGVWEGKKSQYWLDKAIDTWEIIDEDAEIILNLVTQRGRKILGSRSFLFEKNEDETVGEIAEKVLLHFYKIYVPKEIRVFTDFPNRKEIAEKLSKKFDKNVPIFIQYDLTPTTKKGLMQNKFDSVIKKINDAKNIKDIQKNIKKEFKLRKIPKRIEAYDVAHISGENVVTAKVVWEEGKFLNNQNEVWQFEDSSEPQAITDAIKMRFTGAKNLPDLVLIDGGKTQINAAIKGFATNVERRFRFISAVKPSGRHNEVSHFLDENLNRIEIADADTFFFLTNLRDKSHDLANRTHGNIRDINHFYELATLLPAFSEKERREILQKAGSIKRLKEADLKDLKSIFDAVTAKNIYGEIRRNDDLDINFAERIIPIRFDAEDGNAADLQPISFRNSL